MGKLKTVFSCQSCGHQAPKWLGRCPDCGSWNSIVEEPGTAPDKRPAWGARTGGKPVRFLKAVRGLTELIKSRYRKSSPVKGTIYFVGPAAARAGLKLREEGRKGDPVQVYR